MHGITILQNCVTDAVMFKLLQLLLVKIIFATRIYILHMYS